MYRYRAIDVWSAMTCCLSVCSPLYLPLVATVVLDSVSLSTSVVTGAPVHVVRVVVDGLHLLLTPSKPHPQPQARSKAASGHSVCVMELEWLEITFKHCDNALLSEDFQRVCRGCGSGCGL